MRLETGILGYLKADLNKSNLMSKRIQNNSRSASLSAASTYNSKDSAAKKIDSSPNPKLSAQDTVEISPEASDRIALIKARVNAGFYNSQKVDDDISEKLSQYFDEFTNR